jgi:hypothetical protein
MTRVTHKIASLCVGWFTLVSTASAFPSYASFKLNSNNVSQPTLWEIGVLGDLNGDGHPEIGAGSIGFSSTNPSVGLLDVFTSYNSNPSWSIQGVNTDDHLGFQFAALGDVNSDGTNDFIVSVPRDTTTCYSVQPTPSSQYIGEVDVISGATHNTLYSLTGNINGGFGAGLAVLSDIDGDGVKDFVVLASSNVQSGNNHCSILGGQLIVYSGKTGAIIPGHTISLSSLGGFLTNVGDVDNDGYDDFADTASGYLLVYSGKTSALLGSTPISAPVVGIARVGDVNADSHADIAVATQNGTLTSGNITVYSGSSLSALWSTSIPYVSSVAGIGDLDGNGITDLGVTGMSSGAAYPSYIQFLSGSTGATLAKNVLSGPVDVSSAKIIPLGLIDGDSVADFGLAQSWNYSDTSSIANVYVFLSGTPNPHDPLVPRKDSYYPIGGSFYNL